MVPQAHRKSTMAHRPQPEDHPISTRLAVTFAAIAVALLVAVGCGTESAGTTSASADAVSEDTADHEGDHDDEAEHDDNDEHGASGHDGHHGHATVDVSDLSPTPAIELTLTADAMGGWTGRAIATDHDIAPLSASTDHVAGQGHMHLFVNGERIGRLYNEWFHLDPLGEGDHDVRVELSSNTHGALSVGDDIIEDQVTVSDSGGNGHDHGHDDEASGVEVDGAAPSVSLDITPDAAGMGWNVHAVVDNFVLAPESASTAHVDGEGHMHLLVDGKKVARLYGEWFHLRSLSEGDHSVSVELSTNDHRDVLVDGSVVAASTTITETGDAMAMEGDEAHGHGAEADDGHDHSSATGSTGSLSDADQVLSITVSGGAVSGDSGRQDIALGSTVAILVASDVAEEVHLHGYDVLVEAPEGGTAELVFTADIPGLFEVELEQSGELLVELAVQ